MNASMNSLVAKKVEIAAMLLRVRDFNSGKVGDLNCWRLDAFSFALKQIQQLFVERNREEKVFEGNWHYLCKARYFF